MWTGVAADVHAFVYRTEGVDAAHLAAAVALLSIVERERQARFGFARDRRDYAVAHALLRVVLGSALGLAARDVELTADARGRPLVTPSPSRTTPPAFSLSHCHGVVACAVALEGEVGIDVERVDAAFDLGRVASEAFTPAERKGLETCDAEARLDRFYELWTLKEALFKASGLAPGQLVGASFTFADGGAVSLTASSLLPPYQWSARVTDVCDCCKLAIVTSHPPGSTRQLLLHEFDASEFLEAAGCDGSRAVPNVSAAS